MLGSSNGEKAPNDSASTVGGYYQSITQKTKLILPTAIWILIFLATLCFLCLLSSLNRTLNTIDTIIEKDVAAHHSEHAAHHQSLHFEEPADLAKLASEALKSPDEPSSSSSKKATTTGTVDPLGKDFDKVIGEIFDTMSSSIPQLGRNGRVEPISGSIVISSSSSLPNEIPSSLLSSGGKGPFGGILDKLLGGSGAGDSSISATISCDASGRCSTDTDDSDQLLEAPSAPLVNANIDKLNININSGSDNTYEHYRNHKHHKLQQDPFDVNGLTKAFESVIGGQIPGGERTDLPPFGPLGLSLSLPPMQKQSSHQSWKQNPMFPSMGFLQVGGPGHSLFEDLFSPPKSAALNVLSSSKHRPSSTIDEQTPVVMIMSGNAAGDGDVFNDIDAFNKMTAGNKKPTMSMQTTKPLFKSGPVSPYELHSNAAPIAIDIPRLSKQQHQSENNNNKQIPSDELTGNDSLDTMLETIVSSLFPFESLAETSKFGSSSSGSPKGIPQNHRFVSVNGKDKIDTGKVQKEPLVEYVVPIEPRLPQSFAKNQVEQPKESSNHEHHLADKSTQTIETLPVLEGNQKSMKLQHEDSKSNDDSSLKLETAAQISSSQSPTSDRGSSSSNKNNRPGGSSSSSSSQPNSPEDVMQINCRTRIPSIGGPLKFSRVNATTGSGSSGGFGGSSNSGGFRNSGGSSNSGGFSGSSNSGGFGGSSNSGGFGGSSNSGGFGGSSDSGGFRNSGGSSNSGGFDGSSNSGGFGGSSNSGDSSGFRNSGGFSNSGGSGSFGGSGSSSRGSSRGNSLGGSSSAGFDGSRGLSPGGGSNRFPGGSSSSGSGGSSSSGGERFPGSAAADLPSDRSSSDRSSSRT